MATKYTISKKPWNCRLYLFSLIFLVMAQHLINTTDNPASQKMSNFFRQTLAANNFYTEKTK